MSKTDDTRLEVAFEPEQVAALEHAVQAVREGMVTREEFARLEAMVKTLLERLPEPAVTPREVVIIAATVAHHIGRPIRIRGARRLARMSDNAWGTRGRVSIQAARHVR